MSGETPPGKPRRTARYGEGSVERPAATVDHDTDPHAEDNVRAFQKARHPTAPLATPVRTQEPPSFAESTSIDGDGDGHGPGDGLASPAPSGTSVKTGRHRRIDLLEGRYELRSQLSEGGMGRVYRALHRDLGREFAIKVVLDGNQEDPETREQFLREARLASALQHPNIVSVTDFGVDEVLGYFLVMELLEGETLRSRIGRARPSMSFSVGVVDRIALAVRYIHGRGILHGDLKPENIFLATVDARVDPDNIKLLDFGSSWHRESPPEVDVFGTPPYVAPERYLGDPPTPASDVYSLGIVLYELLAGAPPFDGSVFEIMKRQLHHTPIPPSKSAREPVPARLDALVLRAIARQPSERFATMDEFHEALQERMEELGLHREETVQSDFDRETAIHPAEPPLAILRDSPLPFAVFRADGDLAVASSSFLAVAHDGDGLAEDFGSLRMVKEQPKLLEAFAEAAKGKAHVRRLVLAPDGTAQILVLAAAVRQDDVVSVYATIIGTS